MSLSPRDDPRTWLVPGPREVPRPPLHVRLLYYKLTTDERALLRAMCEYSRDGLGSGCRASHETYALSSGLHVKTIHNLIHGRYYIDPRPKAFIGPMNAEYVPGLIKRRILIERAPVKKPSRRLRRWHTDCAIYDFNEAALSLRKDVLEKLENGVQQTIPGIPRPPRPGEPVDTPEHPAPGADSTRHHVPDHPAPGADSTRHHVPDHPAPRADDTRAFDSKTLDTRALYTRAAGGNSKTPPRCETTFTRI
jgi:hypothetical protein